MPPAWDATGIHGGVARPSEWDLVTTVPAPEIEGDAVDFVVLPDGSLLVEQEEGDATLEPLAAAVEQKLQLPYRARGVRQTDVLWAVSARRIETASFEAEGERIELTETADGKTCGSTACPCSAASRLSRSSANRPDRRMRFMPNASMPISGRSG